jgi:uncharacterized protein YoxC
MLSFITRISAFFTLFIARSAEQIALLLNIVAYLKRLKRWVAETATTLGEVALAITNIYGQLADLIKKVAGLQQVKTNVETVIYNYGKDTSVFKPKNNPDPVDAKTMFEYVMNQRVNKPIVPGTTVHLEFAGDEKITLSVNGATEDGAPLEKLAVTIAEDGSYSFEYAPAPYDNELEEVATDAEKAEKAMKNSQRDVDNMTGDMNDLMATEMPIAVIVPKPV